MYSKDRWRNEEKRGTEKGRECKRKMVEDGGINRNKDKSQWRESKDQK